MAAHQVVQCRGRAFVAHMPHLHMRELPEQHARGVALQSRSVRSENEPVLSRFAVVHQLLQVGDGHILVGNQHQPRATDLGQRLQVRKGFVMDLVGQRSFAHDAALDDQEGVAILAGGLQIADRQRAGGTGLVFYDDRLAQFLLQAFRQQPRQRVGTAAGRPRHHQTDRLAGPSLLGLSHGHAAGDTNTDRQGVTAPPEMIGLLLHVYPF